MSPFHRGKHWRVVNSKVDLVPFPKGVVQNGERDRVRVRNNIFYTKGLIWEPSELVRGEIVIRVEEVVLRKTVIFIVSFAIGRTNARTRPFAKILN